jgi:hypothetical protein
MNARLKPFLWVGTGDPPAEYTTYQLCLMFHCLPTELRRQPYQDVAALIACMNAEAEVEKQRGDGALDPNLRGAKRG